MRSFEQIRNDSAELRSLNARIHTTCLERDKSKAHREIWSQACSEFHSRYDSLSFPGGSQVLSRVRQNDPRALEATLRFLEADPYHFRSGYLKQDLWRWLARCELSVPGKARLENAALAYLDRRISREFWAMCKTMSVLGSSRFWIAVSNAALEADSPRARRALYLIVHGANIHSGARMRREFYMSLVQQKYGTG
jgi:hypothetical protein